MNQNGNNNYHRFLGYSTKDHSHHLHQTELMSDDREDLLQNIQINHLQKIKKHVYQQISLH
uniref:Putative ovule protein n=1 Tax=Solanum chacoense TaxID=4108 RepID=A0A0V0HAN9_SOLCH